MVITKLNENVLKEIADRGNGEYIDGSNTENAVEYIKEELNRMDKRNLKPNNLPSTRTSFNGSSPLAFYFYFWTSSFG